MKEFWSQPKTREATCHLQTRKHVNAIHRSRKSWNKKKRPDPINQMINQSSNLTQKIPGRTKIETRKTNQVHTTDLMHLKNNTSDKMTKIIP